ncbi:hypothetical protein [Spiroplasma endosymbiont of Polydrusus formosus]|uniref:hypothetical protein n=1 Tax=Spiroplasma endosymbiont of Polydrusus formosus TaxID=3139326 RepID=UPI0035B514C6
MLKVGIIGTDNIVSEFITACCDIQGVQISSFYSHSLEKAKFVALKNNLTVNIVDNFEDMLDFILILFILLYQTGYIVNKQNIFYSNKNMF